MSCIDINCDLGEGKANDASIMPLISSANISCGYHAGDESTIRNTIRLALDYGVGIGAHPGFADKANFGRVEIILPVNGYYGLVIEQLKLFKQIAEEEGAMIHHIKAHGALYNMAVKNETIANELAKASFDFDPSLIFYGLSNSRMLDIAMEFGLQTASEVFADRSYEDDGTLTPRGRENAVHMEATIVANQALMMAQAGKVLSSRGKHIPVKADTICIHGDLPQAYLFVKAVNQCLKENNIEIKSI